VEVPTESLMVLNRLCSINVLNGAKRLNVWNYWNGPVPIMNVAKRLNVLNDLNGLR